MTSADDILWPGHARVLLKSVNEPAILSVPAEVLSLRVKGLQQAAPWILTSRVRFADRRAPYQLARGSKLNRELLAFSQGSINVTQMMRSICVVYI